MLYQGIIGGGSSPVEPVDLSPVLLWTNPSPTSAFTTQTVNLDLTKYVGVIVEYREDSGTDKLINRSFIKKGESTLGAGTTTSTNVGIGRKVSCSDTGVTFGQGYASSADSNLVIPIKIYGVKEYVVEVADKFPKVIRMTSYIPEAGKATLLVTFDVKNFSKIKFNISSQFYTGASAVYWLSSIPTTNREMLNGNQTEIVDGTNEISIPSGISYCTIRAETNKGLDDSFPLSDINFE